MLHVSEIRVFKRDGESITEVTFCDGTKEELQPGMGYYCHDCKDTHPLKGGE